MKRFSRIFIITLALLLAFMPMSVLADASKKEINYVSLGDSLAAGLLSDGETIGEGYVGYIVNKLEAYGYDVSMKNFGIPGDQTTDVFNQITEAGDLLKNADIVTISAGANDLLGKLDFSLIDFDPNEIGEVAEEMENIFMDMVSEAGAVIEEFNPSVLSLEAALEVVKEKVSPYLGILPEEIRKEIDSIEANLQSVWENMTAADHQYVDASIVSWTPFSEI